MTGVWPRRLAWIGVALGIAVSTVALLTAIDSGRLVRARQNTEIAILANDYSAANSLYSSITTQLWFTNNPEAPELAGRIALFAAADLGISESDRINWLSLALSQFRIASLDRPLWPYPWVGIATVKSMQGEWDEELAQAIRNAHKLGHREHPIIVSLASIRLKSGAEQMTELLPILDAALHKELNRSPRRWVIKADQAGLGKWVCEQANLHIEAHATCQELGWLAAS